MESLLCDEVWLSSPSSPLQKTSTTQHVTKSRSFASHNIVSGDLFHMTKEDCENALIICLEQENNYTPKSNYLQYLGSKNLITARFKSIQWFIKCRSRLNLSFETVFNAANYLDRFISMNQYNIIEWDNWIIEVLSIACLSIASKFIDMSTPTLPEINQIEDMEHTFEASTIQRMEVKVLKVLDWRLACTTLHSYVELFARTTNHHHIINAQLNHLLLGAISDAELLEFRPSVVAVTALLCCLDKSLSTSSIAQYYSSLTVFFNQHQKDDLVRCRKKMMKMELSNDRLYKLVAKPEGQYHYNYGCPSSPTTVLLKERININDFHVDLSLFNIKYLPNINLASPPRKKPKSTT